MTWISQRLHHSWPWRAMCLPSTNTKLSHFQIAAIFVGKDSMHPAPNRAESELRSGCLPWRQETPMAIEHGHLWVINPLQMVIFHGCVSLPEGKSCVFCTTSVNQHIG